MRMLCTALFLIATNLVVGPQSSVVPQTVSTRFMAFCVDGDGALSDWVNTRYEAFVIGRDHERAGRQHRWEIWVQQGETAPSREPSCALVADMAKPETVKVQNTCSRCVKFFISRTAADGSVRSKEFTMKPNQSRHFRKLPGAKIAVDSERDCPQ